MEADAVVVVAGGVACNVIAAGIVEVNAVAVVAGGVACNDVIV